MSRLGFQTIAYFHSLMIFTTTTMMNNILKVLPSLLGLLLASQILFAQSEIVINELMAKNTTYAEDEAGQFDDYIELRNNSATNFQNLKDWHLTDTLGILDKWQFPDEATLAPHGYLVIWADEDGSQGDLHCNFKLDGDGEELYLINPDGEIVDQVIFGEQEEDMSYSRIPNGTGDFVIKNGTIGFNNENTSSVDSQFADSFKIYPNPTQNILHIQNLETQSAVIEIFDLLGNRIFNQEMTEGNATCNLSNVSTGMYIITINGIFIDRLVKL